MEDEQGLSLEGEQQDKEQEVHVDQKQKQQEQKKSDAVASSNSSGKKSNKNEYKVRVVAQRCDNAELLVDNKSKWIGIGRGLILHVSFAKGCDSSCLPKVVRTLLRIPLLTEGVWGDGNAPMSVVDMCQKIRNDAKEGNNVTPLFSTYALLNLKSRREGSQRRERKATISDDNSSGFFDFHCEGERIDILQSM
eukprot:m.174290 g.174290  ORF g.174290 m.174290 type:complete len:193 (+) comp15405_c0_seq5:12-590(+)